MSLSAEQLQRFDRLASGYCDQALSPDELAQLEALLQTEAALGQRFLRYLALHGNLAWDLAGRSDRGTVPFAEAPRSKSRWRRRSAILALAAVAAAMLLVLALSRSREASRTDCSQTAAERRHR